MAATTLIVLAHPEPTSFTADWARASAAAAERAGDAVLWSDIYAQGFDPAERGSFFGVAPFDPLKAQDSAQASGTLPADVAAEVEKIRKADRVIFHFPIWWFSMPAILKGWCDRALVHGALHDVDNRFDTGPCRGKTALFCVSTGASAVEVGPRGKEGRLDLQLWPLAYTLRYCGFDIAEPVAAHDVHGYWEGVEKLALEDRLREVLAGQQAVIDGFDARPRWDFNADSDFDGEGRLKEGAPVYWPFVG